jgi:hypothetical protein
MELLQGLRVDDSDLELKPGKASEQLISEWAEASGGLRDVDITQGRAAIQSCLAERESSQPAQLKAVLRLEAERAQGRATKRLRASRGEEALLDRGRDRLEALRKRRDQRARGLSLLYLFRASL